MTYNDVCLMAPTCVMTMIVWYVLCYVMLYYAMSCYQLWYNMIMPCWRIIFMIRWFIMHKPHKQRLVNHVKYKSYSKYYVYMSHRLIMSWLNGGLTYIINLCHDFNLWEPHACMYVTCIKILYRYVMYGYISYDIYACYDIMWIISLRGV